MSLITETIRGLDTLSVVIRWWRGRERALAAGCGGEGALATRHPSDSTRSCGSRRCAIFEEEDELEPNVEGDKETTAGATSCWRGEEHSRDRERLQEREHRSRREGAPHRERERERERRPASGHEREDMIFFNLGTASRLNLESWVGLTSLRQGRGIDSMGLVWFGETK